jgi:hypothetical protein
VPTPQHSLYIPFALKLHAFGLSRLQDGEWCGTILYDNAKRPYRGRQEPRGLFRRPVSDGFLFHLGIWLFDEYLEPWDSDYFIRRTIDFWYEYFEDYLKILMFHGVALSDPLVEKGNALLRYMDELFNAGENGFYSAASKNRRAICKQVEVLRTAFSEKLEQLKAFYAQDYAERVFHDRQLCGYIAELILDIGIDGTTDDETGPDAFARWMNPPIRRCSAIRSQAMRRLPILFPGCAWSERRAATKMKSKRKDGL